MTGEEMTNAKFRNLLSGILHEVQVVPVLAWEPQYGQRNGALWISLFLGYGAMRT